MKDKETTFEQFMQTEEYKTLCKLMTDVIIEKDREIKELKQDLQRQQQIVDHIQRVR